MTKTKNNSYVKQFLSISLLIFCASITGCASKRNIPYAETEAGRSKIAYDTGLANLKQKNREGLVSRTEFHKQWIELLKPTPNYWTEKEFHLDTQYSLYRVSRAIDMGQAKESDYQNLAQQINNRTNQINNQINHQNQAQSQHLQQMMEMDYRHRQQEFNNQRELNRQQLEASRPNRNSISCVSRNHGPGLPTYTDCN
jgi:hypothetical protein